MNKKLILFGNTQIAEIAHYYFTNESDYEVVAFCVDSAYIKEDSFCGLPIVPFETVEEFYSPDDHEMFISMGFSKVNTHRKAKYLAAKEKGFRLASFISANASVQNDGKIGDNCFIFEENTIQPFVEIGDNVILWSGNHIGHHSKIGSHCFIASHVVVSGGVTIGDQCFIGVNATLRDNITVGDKCVLGAGALLLSDADPEGVYGVSATERSRVPSSKLRG